MSQFITRSPPDHSSNHLPKGPCAHCQDIEHRTFLGNIKITILLVIGYLALISVALLALR